MASDKVTRLLALFQVLLDAGIPLTARELRTRVAGYSDDDTAFRRTFERDKSELGEMLGHPVRAEPVPGTDPPIDGYRLRPDEAYLADPGLTGEERRALAVAASAVRLAGIDPAGGVTKLGAGANVGAHRPAAATELPVDAAVVALFQAVAERRTAEFTYRQEPRLVHPLRLRFTKGRWYLTAWDTGRDGERQFRLDRLEGAVRTGDPGDFDARPVTTEDALDEPWAMGDGPIEEVRLQVDAHRAEAARRAAPRTPVEDQPDGSVVLILGVRNHDALVSFALGFLEEAEVLSPAAVRERLVAQVRERLGPVGSPP